jgi:hypothetical protein
LTGPIRAPREVLPTTSAPPVAIDLLKSVLKCIRSAFPPPKALRVMAMAGFVPLPVSPPASAVAGAGASPTGGRLSGRRQSGPSAIGARGALDAPQPAPPRRRSLTDLVMGMNRGDPPPSAAAVVPPLPREPLGKPPAQSGSALPAGEQQRKGERGDERSEQRGKAAAAASSSRPPAPVDDGAARTSEPANGGDAAAPGPSLDDLLDMDEESLTTFLPNFGLEVPPLDPPAEPPDDPASLSARPDGALDSARKPQMVEVRRRNSFLAAIDRAVAVPLEAMTSWGRRLSRGAAVEPNPLK